MTIRAAAQIRSRVAAVAIPMASILLALGVASASAVALHELSSKGCIADIGDTAGCGAATQGLDSARGIAVSPDGKSVYAVANGDRALVRFDRTPDGALSNPSCIGDVGGPADCGPGNTAQGLGGTFAVAVSPDGQNVYVVSNSDDAIVTFDRAPDGALSNPSCIEDVPEPPAVAVCGSTAQGLDSARAVTVSSDGASVYALGNVDDALVRFDRGPNGALSNPSCIADSPDLAGCGSMTEGLDAARGAVVSQDGSSLYAVSDVDDTIVRFDRAPSGALSHPGCIGDVGGPADCGTGNTAEGLNGAKGLAVSPNGANVYISSIADNAIVSFDRDASGVLSNPSCIEDVGGTAGCGSGNTAQGLQDARAVAVSPDGSNVYSVAGDDSAIVTFDRAPDGALSNPSCIEDVPEPPAMAVCGSTAQGLNDVQDVAISPDGGSVYTASSFDDAIVSFARELSPVCVDSSSSGAAGAMQTVPLDCSDPNGDPLAISIASGPANGTLGPIDQAARIVPYTPNPAFSGVDSIEIHATADGKLSNQATVGIAVAPGAGGQDPTGPQGVVAPQPPAGSDATLTCKPKGKKIKCTLAFAVVTDVTKVRLSRHGVIYASGKPVSGPDGMLVLRFRRSKPLPSGRYVLAVIQGAGATRVVTRSRLGVGRRIHRTARTTTGTARVRAAPPTRRHR
jgi:Bacterial Ig domain